MTRDALWAGPFGNAYVARQKEPHRGAFWARFYEAYPVKSVLEVGCGVGYNLRHAKAERVYGMDVNAQAVAQAEQISGAVIAHQSLFDRGFSDASFELVMCVGVLIHVDRAMLGVAILELIRLSSKYVFVGEYEAEVEEVVPYRGEKEALWKRPYRKIISERLGPHIDGGRLDKRSGFDRVTWSLWEK